MKTLAVLSVLLCMNHSSFGQYSSKTILTSFQQIKTIVQPAIIQLPDSMIVFPITGLTNINTVSSSLISGAYTEIELWIIDSRGTIIYNSVITTTLYNPALNPFDQEYCRYMKLQSNYVRNKHLLLKL